MILIPLIVYLIWWKAKPRRPGQVTGQTRLLKDVFRHFRKPALIPHMLYLTVEHMFKIHVWGVFWLLLILRWHGWTPLILLPAAYYLVIIAVYMSLPSQPNENFTPELEFGYTFSDPGASFPRLIMHVLPLLVAYCSG